jgi:DNA-binding transcriptional LysR family regulator
VLGCGLARTTTAAPAIRAHPGSTTRREASTATDSGPRNSSVTATRPRIRETRDIDDWLAIIAAGDGVGVTPEGTTAQYRRDGVVFRPLRDAPLVPVQMIWRQHDPHPSTHAAIALLTELYGQSPA